MDHQNPVEKLVTQLGATIQEFTEEIETRLKAQHSLNPAQFRNTPSIYNKSYNDPEDPPWQGEWDNTDDSPTEK